MSRQQDQGQPNQDIIQHDCEAEANQLPATMNEKANVMNP